MTVGVEIGGFGDVVAVVVEERGETTVEFSRETADQWGAAVGEANRRSKVVVLCMSDFVRTMNLSSSRQGTIVAGTLIYVCGRRLISRWPKYHPEPGP